MWLTFSRLPRVNSCTYTCPVFWSVCSYSAQNQFTVHGFYLSATTTKHLIQNMKCFILSLVIFLTLFSNIRSILQCFVKENSSNEQKHCIFPFTLDTDPDFVYNECTKIHDNFGKYWCSTKVSDTVRTRYQAIPISAHFVSKLFSIVPKNTHWVLFFGI